MNKETKKNIKNKENLQLRIANRTQINFGKSLVVFKLTV